VLAPERTTVQPADKKISVETDGNYVPGYAQGPLSKPIYPPAALAAHVGQFVEYVTITTDETGHVSDVSRNWRGISSQSRFSDDFLQAVENAVRGWDFVPSQIVCYQEGANGDPVLVSATNLSEKIDLKFTFEASGLVR
jgi:hypothetical protein